MVIVNVLPQLNLVCASLVDLGVGAVIEELQINLSTGVTRRIGVESDSVLLGDDVSVSCFVLNLLVASSLKLTEHLGKPWYDGGLNKMTGLLKELPNSVEMHFERSLLENTAAGLSAVRGKGCASSKFRVERAKREESLLFGNSHWITMNPPVVLS